MISKDSNLPPHWVAATDQLSADIRDSQRRGRESQERMWRRAGYSEAQVAEKMAQHDQRMSTLHEAVQSGMEDRSPNVSVSKAGTATPENHPPPEPAPKREAKSPPPREVVEEVEPVPRRRPRREPVEAEFEPLPGRASRWLTGYYRYGVGVVAGTAVALVVWIALQAAGATWLGMTMWSWPSMLLAGFLPAIGLLWWIAEVRSEVKHYIDFGGRVPVRFRRW